MGWKSVKTGMKGVKSKEEKKKRQGKKCEERLSKMIENEEMKNGEKF